MCGIVACLGKSNISVEEVLPNLAHRGPDFSGMAQVGMATLGHTRLAIVDPLSGPQPLHGKHDNAVDNAITVNGEIYNFQALRSMYPASYQTNSDCEVLLEVCRRGINLNEIDGVFAFVYVDAKDQFVIARDPIGVNPLFYGWDNGSNCLWVASERKALLHCRDVVPFPPGHMWTQASEEPIPYYTPAWRTVPPALAENKEKLLKLITDATYKRMMSDVEFGVLLSGGLDSSIVAAITARFSPVLHSFAIGLEGSPDLKAARIMAERLKTTHHEVIYTIDEGLAALPDVVKSLETVDTTTIRASTPMWLLAKYIRTHTNIKFVLSGEGSDEALMGYLYNHYAPDPKAAEAEAVRRVNQLYMYDCQRANLSMMAHGIETRVPFLDLKFLDFVMQLKGEVRLPRNGIEKYCLRDACESLGIPESILWRKKEQFSDGVGYEWIDSLKAFAKQHVTPDMREDVRVKFGREVTCDEQCYYMHLFATQFPPNHCLSVGKTTETWAPQWCTSTDPSGRAASIHDCAF